VDATGGRGAARRAAATQMTCSAGSRDRCEYPLRALQAAGAGRAADGPALLGAAAPDRLPADRRGTSWPGRCACWRTGGPSTPTRLVPRLDPRRPSCERCFHRWGWGAPGARTLNPRIKKWAARPPQAIYLRGCHTRAHGKHTLHRDTVRARPTSRPTASRAGPAGSVTVGDGVVQG
jgi:hypothetical protein